MVAAKPGPWQYHSEVLTDQSPEDVCINAVREKLLEYLPQEVPYNITQVKLNSTLLHPDNDFLHSEHHTKPHSFTLLTASRLARFPKGWRNLFIQCSVEIRDIKSVCTLYEGVTQQSFEQVCGGNQQKGLKLPELKNGLLCVTNNKHMWPLTQHLLTISTDIFHRSRSLTFVSIFTHGLD